MIQQGQVMARTVVLTWAIKANRLGIVEDIQGRFHEPCTWRNHHAAAVGASRLSAIRRMPASMAFFRRSAVGSTVAVGVSEQRKPFRLRRRSARTDHGESSGRRR